MINVHHALSTTKTADFNEDLRKYAKIDFPEILTVAKTIIRALIH